MSIELINDEDIKTRRGSGKKSRGKKYENYLLAVEKILPFIKESIEKSKNGIIRLKTKDIAKEMDLVKEIEEMGNKFGGKFENKHSTSIMWGLKFTLFDKGIMVRSGKHKDGDDILIMRKRTEIDKLPPSLEAWKKENEKKENEKKENEKKENEMKNNDY